jgi:hypothetical protein
VANSNLGNGNLRPESLGETRRERSPERAKPTAETGSPRTGYGNVGLFLTRGLTLVCADFLVADAVQQNQSPTGQDLVTEEIQGSANLSRPAARG